MEWWQPWDRVSTAFHPVASNGDHQVSGWLAWSLLAGVAVSLFVLAWAVLRKPPAARVPTSAPAPNTAPAAAGGCAGTSARRANRWRCQAGCVRLAPSGRRNNRFA